MKKIIVALLCLLSTRLWAEEPLSVIFFIGDGMGPAYTAAYRYYADDPATQAIETTVFDSLLVGMARTYPRDKTYITDSAASATALAAGVKTFNGAIGVDVDRKPVQSLLELTKARGYQTALVATSTINHATPASFVAHVNSRQNYAEIADQFFDGRINGGLKVDLMLGGGRKYFAREDRDLTAEFRAAGYTYLTALHELDQLDRLPALGLFAEDGLPHVIDTDQRLHLRAMTAKALKLLGRKPFFLLVEASQVDWCGHANDIACAMAEMQDAAATLQLLKDYVDQHPHTLLVGTADHSTGGLSIGADNRYEWNTRVIRRIGASGAEIARTLLAAPKDWQPVWQELTGISLSAQEAKGMQQLLDKAAELARDNASAAHQEIVRKGVASLSLALINQRSHTGWTTLGHTGEDVQVFAYGRGREAFIGHMNNTDIAQRIFTLLEQ